MTQFRHGSCGLLRSHLHLLFLHWSQALLLRRRTCFSPAFPPTPAPAPYGARPIPPRPALGRSVSSSPPSSSYSSARVSAWWWLPPLTGETGEEMVYRSMPPPAYCDCAAYDDDAAEDDGQFWCDMNVNGVGGEGFDGDALAEKSAAPKRKRGWLAEGVPAPECADEADFTWWWS